MEVYLSNESETLAEDIREEECLLERANKRPAIEIRHSGNLTEMLATAGLICLSD